MVQRLTGTTAVPGPSLLSHSRRRKQRRGRNNQKNGAESRGYRAVGNSRIARIYSRAGISFPAGWMETFPEFSSVGGGANSGISYSGVSG